MLLKAVKFESGVRVHLTFLAQKTILFSVFVVLPDCTCNTVLEDITFNKFGFCAKMSVMLEKFMLIERNARFETKLSNDLYI